MNDDFIPPKVVHRPLAPPRKSISGEVIYLDLWREWATARPRDWHAIFKTNGPVRQRAASVAASFMVFMGSQGGKGFTHTAKIFAKEPCFLSRERAFIAAWAINNMRCVGMNSGLRSSEYMLAAEYPLIDWPRGIDRRKVPNITQDDNDILESMVRWWSTDPAAVMREIAEPMISAMNRKAMSRMFDPIEESA
nr:hypothetical protein [uncultured Rhodoferax sp.]